MIVPWSTAFVPPSSLYFVEICALVLVWATIVFVALCHYYWIRDTAIWTYRMFEWDFQMRRQQYAGRVRRSREELLEAWARVVEAGLENADWKPVEGTDGEFVILEL